MRSIKRRMSPSVRQWPRDLGLYMKMILRYLSGHTESTNQMIRRVLVLVVIQILVVGFGLFAEIDHPLFYGMIAIIQLAISIRCGHLIFPAQYHSKHK